MVERSEEGIAGCTSHSCYRAGLESSAVVVNSPQVTAWQQPNCDKSEGLCVNCLPWREQCAEQYNKCLLFLSFLLMS